MQLIILKDDLILNQYVLYFFSLYLEIQSVNINIV